MQRIIQRLLQAWPLLGALPLLRYLPTITTAPPAGVWPVPWRLDALALIFLLSLCASVALPALYGSPHSLIPWSDTLRALTALGVLLPALLLDHLLALPAALVLASALVRSWRWAAAAGVLLAGLILLRIGGGTTWPAAETAGVLTPGVFLMLVAATCVGLPCYPAGLAHQRYDPVRLMLQPIWLLPLLRTFAWGPWHSGWSVAIVLLGGATALWSASTALWSTSETERVERVVGTWQGLALACVGLATPVAAASALWQVLAYGLGLALLQPYASERGRSALWAAPLPPSATFVACWLAQGAAAASGAFLLAAALWLATMLSGLAVLRLMSATRPSWRSAGWLLAACSIALGVVAPLPLRWLVMPAVELLQGGLTPFGLLDIWPWVGIAALDAGQRRVAVLPSIAVALMAVVSAALLWLLARLFGWSSAEAAGNPATGTEAWTEIDGQVWWTRGTRRRG